MILLNKADSADPKATAEWIEYYRDQGIPAITCDCRSGKGLNRFLPTVKEMLSETLEKREEKGLIMGRAPVMVVGIPNVGKSSFINRMAGSKRAKVEDRPGVTRGRQWVNISSDPGLSWHAGRSVAEI